ncbi:MAG: hypothetical protein SGILL_006030, partial [Bacillariaceae sp.]
RNSKKPEMYSDTDETHNTVSKGKTKERPRAAQGPDLEVGARVYAEFPGNNLYYWGNVIKKYKSSKFSPVFFYDVLYDDGDTGVEIRGRVSFVRR